MDNALTAPLDLQAAFAAATGAPSPSTWSAAKSAEREAARAKYSKPAFKHAEYLSAFRGDSPRELRYERDLTARALAIGASNHLGHEGNPYPLDQAAIVVACCNHLLGEAP